jgi:hypothetical protein
MVDLLRPTYARERIQAFAIKHPYAWGRMRATIYILDHAVFIALLVSAAIIFIGWLVEPDWKAHMHGYTLTKIFCLFVAASLWRMRYYLGRIANRPSLVFKLGEEEAVENLTVFGDYSSMPGDKLNELWAGGVQDAAEDRWLVANAILDRAKKIIKIYNGGGEGRL